MSYLGNDDDGLEEENRGPDPVDDLANAPVPDNTKQLRACKQCGLIQTVRQFESQGCENCPFFDMEENGCERYVTAFYDGAAAVMDPRDSWAAKWIRVDVHVPGIYAINVIGELDRETEEDLENRGLRWRCRPSGSQ